MLHVTLIAHTPEPERVVAAAAKLCYSKVGATNLLDGLTEEKSARFLNMLSDLGHASPVEHASFTFAIEGVSRALLAQITRHRLASYSVQSQRYVRLDDFQFVVPPEVEQNPEAKKLFLDAMTAQGKAYLELAAALQKSRQAELMAEACGKTLGNLVSVNENAYGGSGGVPLKYAADAAAGTTVLANDLTVSAQVTLTYQLAE